MIDSVEWQLGYQIKRAQHAVRLGMDAALRGVGMTTPQYIALRILERTPGLSNAELARRAFVTAQTMNQIVLKLEANGLLVRQPHRTNGRVQEARLTDRGRERLGLAHPLIDGVARSVYGGLDQDEQRRILTALRSCADALEGNGPAAPPA